MSFKPPFEKILIANRGEIARRIIRTCREMGIRTVAVYAEVDHNAPFVRDADEDVAFEGNAALGTYLNVEQLLDAAQKTGAQAVHPGYGFLSENAEFAQAVEDAGLTWIGPTPHAIREMGSKAQARTLAEQSGVPVVPGRAEAGESDDELLALAEEIGFPVLVKASAGGGGKGMRIVETADAFIEALQVTRREAQSAFGDDHLILEKYISNPRHIEVQILGDTHGNIVHLYERECSIQRRHQKIVEESPSVALDKALRRSITEAAVALAKTTGYVNAGTVEFILDEDDQFYFLEMNTRLQVEHPVTEWVTGLDLVEWQLRVAAGERLDFSQEDLIQRGHAIEVRLYAEDPENDFAPQTGKVDLLQLPHGPGIRWDNGIEQDTEVSAHYDPMLGKLIVYGQNREAAIRRLQMALRDTVLLGVHTNLTFLQAVIQHPAFIAGETTTRFIENHFADWEGLRLSEEDWLTLVAFEIWGRPGVVSQANAIDDAFDPWDLNEGWTNL